jgi:2-polyprenyl-6-methoxyphenol hydroxylase-like FAD-dependent oxidoreductase
MRIAVIGAGVAGLASSLFLARDGHDVVLLERDATPLPPDPGEAFHWNRRGAPQVRHPHAFLARLRNILRDDLPDVRQDLLDAGGTEVAWGDFARETLDDPTPVVGDEDLAMLACRRTTFEWVLRKAALRTERVELRDGIRVTGLRAAPGAEPPRVTGVRTAGGDIDADFVVDAGGRHSNMKTLLGEIGVEVPEEKHDAGMVYLSRFYRLRDGATEPDPQAFNGGTLGYLGYGIFRGDNRTFSLTLAIGVEDKELRALISLPRFDAAAALLPAARPWLDPAISEPIADAHAMAGLVNRVRDLVVDGKPSVLGFAAIGDSLVCTNPLYGRGCSLGTVHARLLSGALRDQGRDLEAVALSVHERAQEEIVPWYHASVAQDEASRLARQGAELGDFTTSLITEGLLPLTRIDAKVSRAFFRTLNLLTTPNAVMQDPELMQRVLAYWQTRDTRPPAPPLGPPRDEMIAALSADPQRAAGQRGRGDVETAAEVA